MDLLSTSKADQSTVSRKRVKIDCHMPDKVPEIPWLTNTFLPEQMEILRRRIKTDTVIRVDHPEYLTVFKLTSIDPGDYVRAIQEPEILKTKVARYDKKHKRVISLPSFSEKWHACCRFRNALLSCQDIQEGKWDLTSKFDYRLATNFMPMYARAIYDYFNATNVLDSCAGWGDRMTGALCASSVKQYVGIDPNPALRKGYTQILSDFGVTVNTQDHTTIQYSNQFKIHTTVFETSRCLLEHELFDFALTGPPFYDFEDYGPHMPKYSDWIEQFYKPLFEITHDHLEGHAFFVVYLNDTISGPIENFMSECVPTFTTFELKGKLGMVGGSSSKIRDVYVFQRGARNQ